MANTHQRSRRGSSSLSRQPSIAETITNDTKSNLTPPKVLIFNGKCSETFKSTVEECVEDCILQFSGESSIYIPKANSNETSRANSIRSQQRRSSTNLTPNLLRLHASSNNNLTLPSIAVTTNRIRQQFLANKHALTEEISEETDPTAESTVDLDGDHQEESLFPSSNCETCSQSSRPKVAAKSSNTLSYRDRQKIYRLSDLVMLGPEPFAHVFNLARSSRSMTRNANTNPRQRTRSEAQNKTEERYEQFDQIKQDLFHRYLWTQKPQVSIRIRPLSTYARPSTLAV